MIRPPALVLLAAVACVGFGCGPVVHHDRTEPPLAANPTATRPPVGVTTRVFHDAPRERDLATTVWYPAIAGTVEHPIYWDGIFPGSGAWYAPRRPTPARFPLVLLSHGSGGDGINLAWLAEALASHGYIAAAVDHPGDRFGDSSVEGRFAAWRRPPDLTTALTQLLADPELGPWIDARRVVAGGHSSGALTALALAGARMQPSTFLAYCHTAHAGSDCPFFDAIDLRRIRDHTDAGRSFRDARIRAVVALAPVLGPAVTATSLRGIAIPVSIVASPGDEIIPFSRNAARYHALIPRSRLTTLPAAGHFVFMPVCNEPGRLIVAQVCVDRPAELDRAAVHAETAAAAITFFDGALGLPSAKASGAARRQTAIDGTRQGLALH